ncbi:MAG: PHP domain-containing protein [Thermoplasmata archaeon]|nr:PHP domain-containing protein [Thermoplasmata archaeon]
MSMTLDLHVHTDYSADGRGTIQEYIKAAKKKGLSGFAVCDHNEIQGALKAGKVARNFKNFIVIRGIEVSSAKGHILGLGVDELIPKHLSVEETVEKITDAGGIPVAPHPYRLASGIGPKALWNNKFAAVEILNNRSMHSENLRARQLAKELKLPCTGGSDAHQPMEIGGAYTEFELTSYNQDELLNELAKGRVKPGGSDAGVFDGTRLYFRLVVGYLKRGMRRL